MKIHTGDVLSVRGYLRDYQVRYDSEQNKIVISQRDDYTEFPIFLNDEPLGLLEVSLPEVQEVCRL